MEGDPKLLTQVFANIIANAEQAISSVRDHGTIKIALAMFDGKVSATFADDGPGIPPEIAGKIFDPFFTTKRPGGGTGLGLTICLAVTKEHGGVIEAKSSPGGGTAFRVILPISLEAASAVRGPAGAASAANSAGLQGHSVLVVDDEESIREIVHEGLTARGMKVEDAASSEEALAHLAEHTYDVVLCDFNMPGLTGGELFNQLRAQASAAVPLFVFMTGDLLDPSEIASFGEKGAHVLQKPFHVAALATLLSELLQPQPAKAG